MTESEIVELVRQVNGTWQNAKPVPPPAMPVWYEDLADLAAGDVRAAFAAYRRGNATFPPTAAQLRALVFELHTPTPRFEHAWAAIHRAITAHGWPKPDRAMAELAGVPLAHELVAAMGGWKCVCLGGPDEFKPTDPGVWRSQAEHAWRALVEEQRIDRSVADVGGALPRAQEARRRLASGPALGPARVGDILPALESKP